ncbi:MAG: hypothetical protein IMY82_03400 [Chloroflexi bacterium]|nr:hypothetical protein [Chloroflexota bacterium]
MHLCRGFKVNAFRISLLAAEERFFGVSGLLLHNGKKIQGVLPARTFFKYSVKPGTHTFKTSLLLVRAVPVTIESKQPGQTHYIRVEYQFGVPFAFKMVEVSAAEALAEIPSCFDITGKKAVPDAASTETKPAVEPRAVKPVKGAPASAAPFLMPEAWPRVSFIPIVDDR